MINILYTTRETPEKTLRTIETMSCMRISPLLLKRWFDKCSMREAGHPEADICEPYGYCVSKGWFFQLWGELSMSN